ncbi:MAG: GGDEF domain-containing protein [Myxococcales bacterium]|nr:GGDEF domain-containing protein [Myxococcales bacterium]
MRPCPLNLLRASVDESAQGGHVHPKEASLTGRDRVGLFGRGKTPVVAEEARVLSPTDMGLDTLGALLRTLGEYPFDQARVTAAAFARLADQWARHITTGTPPPSGNPAAGSADSRRDWAGVRHFVREYCAEATEHTRGVLGDLRQVIWVFIQNLSHQLRMDEATDGRLQMQLERLEQLALGSEPSTLKKEVLSTVVELSRMMEERRQEHRKRMADLGAQVRTLGQELDVTKRNSEVDALTQLFNRRAFDDYVERTLELQRAFGQQACLLMIDVDNFKTVNDTLGHGAGDEVLRKVADTVTRLFIRKSDFVARFGGDEIAVVLRETALADARALAGRLLVALRTVRIEREGVCLEVRGSVGVAPATLNDTPSLWLERADRALYEAKRAGRDQVSIADDQSAA